MVRILAYNHYMNHDQFVKYLSSEVTKAGSQQALALRIGVSKQYLCDVLKGRREPGQKLLDGIGFIRQISYLPKDKEQQL
jgi:hypothetical protein